MRKVFAALCAALLLSAYSCATTSDPQVSTIQALTTTCNAIAASVNTLTAAKSRLSAGQIALVNELQPVAIGLCTPPPPVDTVTALEKARSIAAQLAAVAANPAR